MHDATHTESVHVNTGDVIPLSLYNIYMYECDHGPKALYGHPIDKAWDGYVCSGSKG